MFQRTTAINKILNLTKRKRVIQGGTWAGKTYGIIAVEIDHATKHPGTKITVVAETIPAVRGAFSDFEEIMIQTGRWIEERYHKTDRRYTFANGSFIEFKAFDTEGKAKNAGKRDRLVINEAQYVPWNIANTLIIRTSGTITVDFNPTYEFWAHTELLTDEDAEFLLLKYTDNEALPDTILSDLQDRMERAKTSTYWANWATVYIDGEIGSLEGVVFNDWKQIDTIPEEARYIGMGLDFGYSNDPSAAIAMYEIDGGVIYDEVLYQKGLKNSDINRLITEYIETRELSDSYENIIADSAEPKSIDDLASYGLDISPCKKGRDSVSFGIHLMHERPMSVSSRSRNLIEELRKYRWKEDKDGLLTGKPSDVWNHGIDAARYIYTDTYHSDGYDGNYSVY